MPDDILHMVKAFMPYPPVEPPFDVKAGSLCDVRLAVKDLFNVAGYPTSAGNPFLLARSGIKARTAPLVQRLLDKGARLVGKTKTDELAYSLTGMNCCFGNPVNRSRPDHIPGGSSSGSAVAVSAGLSDIGLGTDTSGSIRLPAAINGLIGWRPTHGLLSLEGCRPLAPSFDTAAFAVRDFDRLDHVMAACGLAATMNPRMPRFVVPTDLLAICEPAIRELFLDCMITLGSVPRMDRLLHSPVEEALDAFSLILRREAWITNHTLLDQDDAVQAPAIRERLEAGGKTPEQDVTSAQAFRVRLRNEILSRFPAETVFVFPTLPSAPPRIDASDHEMNEFRRKAMSILCVAGLIGGAQISVPDPDEPLTLAISFLTVVAEDRWLADVAKTFT